VARLALSGTNVGPSITGMMRVLGKDKVRARFERFLAGG
jgi:glutamyl-tRNA synthetase